MEVDQPEIKAQFKPLEIDISYFGKSVETAMFTQFANQHSRFSVFKHNSRFIWKLLNTGRMLILDTFTNLNIIYRIVSANAEQTPLDIICFEQVTENAGFVILVSNKVYYIATAYLNFYQNRLEVHTNNAAVIDDRNQFSMGSIDWSPTHRIGYVILGQITFGHGLRSFFKVNSNNRFEIFGKKFYRPPQIMQGTLPLICDTEKDNNSPFIIVRTEHRERWIRYFINQRNEVVEEIEYENRRLETDNVASRFTSIWTNGTQNLYLECSNNVSRTDPIRFGMPVNKEAKKYNLKLYDLETKHVHEIKLPNYIYSQLNESLNHSICMASDGILLVSIQPKDEKKLIVQRVPIRYPEQLLTLAIVTYRQSSCFNRSNSQKLPNQLLGIHSLSNNKKEMKRHAPDYDMEESTKRSRVSEM